MNHEHYITAFRILGMNVANLNCIAQQKWADERGLGINGLVM